MPPGSYTTQQLLGLVPSLQSPALFLRNTFFPTVVTFDTEEVYWDKLHDDLRIAPIVTPLSEAPIVEDGQDGVEYIKPAYSKFKFPIKPQDLMRRSAGEPLTGSLTPVQRKQAKVVQLMNKARIMFRRREELMASEVLRTGQLTVTGKGYGTRVINYNRASALTEALASTAKWDSAGDPVADYERMSLTAAQQPGGGPLVNFVHDPKSWSLSKKRIIATGQDKMLDTHYRANDSGITLGPLADKVTYAGRLGQFNMWVYQDWYVDAAGAQRMYMPDNTVIGVGAMEGVRAYGAIQDHASLQPVAEYFKTYQKEDPSIEYLLAQSAPILAPARVNATCCLTVA